MVTSNEIRESIIGLHKMMAKYTLSAGIEQKKYNSVIADLDEFNETELIELEIWLKDVCANEYKAVKEVRELLRDEIWERYKLFNVTGLREQDMLKKAESSLKRIWLNPYRTAAQLDRKARRKSINRHKSGS